MNENTRREIDFGVFLVHRLADHWKRSAADSYGVLSSTGIMDGYIIPFYDVLHTQGEEALVEDITELARKRGAQV